jgi:hypothetical protein
MKDSFQQVYIVGQSVLLIYDEEHIDTYTAS